MSKQVKIEAFIMEEASQKDLKMEFSGKSHLEARRAADAWCVENTGDGKEYKMYHYRKEPPMEQ